MLVCCGKTVLFIVGEIKEIYVLACWNCWFCGVLRTYCTWVNGLFGERTEAWLEKYGTIWGWDIVLILFWEVDITLLTTFIGWTIVFWFGDEIFCLDNCSLYCEFDINGVFCVILIDWFEATLIGIKELETGAEGPTTVWFGLEIIVAWLGCLCEMVTWVFVGTIGILEVETTFF